MKRFFVAIAITVVAAVGIFALTRDGRADEAIYRFVTVSRGDVESSVSATGTLSAVRTVQVGTQVSGQIAELHADFNDRVRKGQLIARLDPTLLQEAVKQAEADVERSAADLKQKEFVFKQSEDMYQNQAVTETEYQNARFSLLMSQANMKASNANLERARRNLQYASIYAPISGVVIERNVDVGQTVAASMSTPQLFLIAEDLSSMQILASVDESDIGRIEVDQPTRFTVQAFTNRTFQGRVRQVRMQSTSTENVVNYTVVVAVDNSSGQLLPGMTATVSFLVQRAENVLKVSTAALRLRPTEEMLAAAATTMDSTAPFGADSAPRREIMGDSAAMAERRAARAATMSANPSGRAGGAGRAQLAQLWYLDDTGQPAFIVVRTGITDGQETEISGPGLVEGMQVIAAVTGGTTSSGVSNPFQSGPDGGRGGFRRGAF